MPKAGRIRRNHGAVLGDGHAENAHDLLQRNADRRTEVELTVVAFGQCVAEMLTERLVTAPVGARLDPRRFGDCSRSSALPRAHSLVSWRHADRATPLGADSRTGGQVRAPGVARRRVFPTRRVTWYDNAVPTFADTLAVVRPHLWPIALSEMSLSETNMVKIPRVVFERFANTLADAA